VGLFIGGKMGKFDKVKAGEKLPGTYCPVCGEVGLRKMTFGGVAWAVCPMDSGMNATVKKLKDAHTGYKLVDDVPEPAPEPTPEPEPEELEEEGDNDA
jgi:hypothetical protein